jgi:hypothetical protein
MDVYGFVAKQADNTIIVGFRGTNPQDIKDWVDDLTYQPMRIPYAGCAACVVHTGIYSPSQTLGR